MHLPDLATTFPKTFQGWAGVPSAWRGRMHALDGTPLREAVDWTGPREALPAVLHPQRTVVGDLIPSTAWGASLANLLTKSSWDALRLPLIAAHHGVCELCGDKPKTLDVHEVWSYDLPSVAEQRRCKVEGLQVFGVQRLEGLMGLCQACHACFHLGFAQLQGRLASTLRRLRALNGWSLPQILGYEQAVFGRHMETSRFYWLLDFSQLQHPEGGLRLTNTWTLCPGDPLIEGKGTLTGIVGIPWKWASEKSWRDPLPLN